MNHHNPRPLINFPSLLHVARNTLATDPRDKVYALLGLLREEVVHDLVPDYEKSLVDVYIDLTMNIIST